MALAQGEQIRPLHIMPHVDTRRASHGFTGTHHKPHVGHTHTAWSRVRLFFMGCERKETTMATTDRKGRPLCISVDPDAEALLRAMTPNTKGMGLLVSELLRKEAHERGVHFGRQKKLTPAQISALRRQRSQGVLIKTLMHDYGLSKVSVYRYLRMPAALGTTTL
jgi:hypothetical protein